MELRQQFLLVFMVDKMKYIVVGLLLIMCQYIFSGENIYDDAISHFIEEIIESQEMSHLEKDTLMHDSIYHHVLLFESNEMFEQKVISNFTRGFKIDKLEPYEVKKYLDTCRNGRMTIFTVEKIDYCERCDAHFFVRIIEFTIIKYREGRYSIDFNGYNIHYVYNCESGKFNYKYCVCGSGSQFRAAKIARRKGWIDKDTYDKMY